MTRVAVIGGGHNGLVCACYLVNAGLEVTVFEANSEPGGCIWTEQLPSGHRLERGAIDHGMILGVADELGLDRFGLEYVFRDLSVGAGYGDGNRLLFHRDLDDTLAGLTNLREQDRSGYGRLAQVGSALLGMLDSFTSPPSLGQIAELGTIGDFDPLHTLLTSAEKLVSAEISDPHLSSALTMYGSFSQLPPWLPGTGLFGLLLPAGHGHGAGRPVGGSARLIKALVGCLESGGGRILTDQAVTSVEWKGKEGRVTTSSGDEYAADVVVSALDVVRTADLLPDRPSDLDRAARLSASGALNIAEFKLDLALSSPAVPGRFGHPEALWLLQQQPGSISKGFAEIAAGRCPSEPAMLWASPSALDPSAAPNGEGVAWLSTFVPARLEGGEWSEAGASDYAEELIEQYEQVTGSKMRDQIVSMKVSGPLTWERRTGARFGNPNHIDMTIDQMFALRPATGRGYRTEVPWLYLTGAGTFPGGGLSGVAGKNTALTLLQDLGGGRTRRFRPAETLSSLWKGWRLYRSLTRP
ncbi:MAG: NAD(P)/FAD-dependent oxidoreductase [bacterium]|nr:NAD(P)/FAD-dependent oxidoreductase [bacterium]MDE0643282.1 NAD(P)/FAD-dependent oxidoreductase [bacterium]